MSKLWGQRPWPARRMRGLSEYINVARCLANDDLTRYTSDMVVRLEQDWARMFHISHAVASTSGTAALHVALGAFDLPRDSEVLLPAITDPGAVMTILAEGLKPAFVDSDPKTGLISVESLEKRLTSHSRCVMVVHLFGIPADMDAILEVTRPRGVFVIEDCAQAHGALYKGRYVGTMGDAGAFSFQALKHLHCGEGGMTIFRDSQLAKRGILFADKGWQRSGPNTGIIQRGLNYRLSALQAAVLRARLPRLPSIIGKRRSLVATLIGELNSSKLLAPPYVPAGREPAWWLVPLQAHMNVSSGMHAKIEGAMRKIGAPVSGRYMAKPLHHQPFIQQQLGLPNPEPCPGALEFLDRTLILSVHEGLSHYHMRLVASAARAVEAEQELIRESEHERINAGYSQPLSR